MEMSLDTVFHFLQLGLDSFLQWPYSVGLNYFLPPQCEITICGDFRPRPLHVADLGSTSYGHLIWSSELIRSDAWMQN